MQVSYSSINNCDYKHYKCRPYPNKGHANSPSYTGKIESQIFKPVQRRYNELTEWIANNYFAKFYQSKFAEKFINKSSNVKNMTTHMAAIGSTLISGMYTIRTLQNDKLDSDRKKTLAINDVLTWGLSTLGAYTIDRKLGKWWGNVTNKYAANYIDKHKGEFLNNPDLQALINKYAEINGIDVKDVNKYILEKYPEAIKTENFDARNINIYMKEYNNFIDSEDFKNYIEKHNKKIDKINEQIKANAKIKGDANPKLISKIIPDKVSDIREFNLDVLKNKNLTTHVDGMGVLKSLFVFGMVYRYIVPVLVMKPANKIGAWYHDKHKKQEVKA